MICYEKQLHTCKVCKKQSLSLDGKKYLEKIFFLSQESNESEEIEYNELSIIYILHSLGLASMQHQDLLERYYFDKLVFIF